MLPGAWTWRRFDREVRPRPGPLLRRLPEFEDAVLIGGCQRSGTTMLTRVVTASAPMVDFWCGQFPELDAALILSGAVPHRPRGRYCFQTTYVDDRWREYLETDARYRLVWCVRNPFSVVTSMLYNWAGFALRDTFLRCGVEQLGWAGRAAVALVGPRAVGRLRRACLLYRSKVAQALALKPRLGDAMMVVDYDRLIAGKDEHLPRIYDFIALAYRPEYAALIHTDSVAKASRLTPRERQTIAELCLETYERARALG